MRDFLDINTIYKHGTETDNYKLIKGIFTEYNFNYWIPNKKHIQKNEYPIRHIYYNENLKDIGKEFTYLVHKKYGQMMSNHTSEIVTCQNFLDKAYGDVLNFGLGLGIIIYPLLEDPTIKSIKIIEFDKGLIDLISPFIFERDKYKKVSIIHADAFTYHRKFNDKFDTIFFDIWPELYITILDEMEYLHKVYNKNLKTKESLMMSWCYEEMKEYFKNN